MLAQLDTASSVPDVVWRLVVVGVGQGLFLSPNTNALMGAAPRAEQGEASGLLVTGRVIGQSLSVAAAGAIFASLGAATAGGILAGQRGALDAGQISALQATFLHGFNSALLACATFAMIGVPIALVRGRDRATHVSRTSLR